MYEWNPVASPFAVCPGKVSAKKLEGRLVKY
jgi:hypothetical protein